MVEQIRSKSQKPKNEIENHINLIVKTVVVSLPVSLLYSEPHSELIAIVKA